MASQDTSESDFLGRGWSFPPAFDRNEKTVLMTERNADIQKSLEILLTTTVGERVMQPKYGCNLEDLLFESLDTTTKTLIIDRIRTAILYFEPRIDAKRIELAAGGDVVGQLTIEIEYVVRSTNSRFNFVFPFYRTEGTDLAFFTASGAPLP
jgi:uncharacterized protein